MRRYQKERFPLVALVISLVPAVLSSGAVVGAGLWSLSYASALLASVAYLFHIRVIDEHRDFAHDNEHYQFRPIQAGIVTKRELRKIDSVCILLILMIAGVQGPYPLSLAAAMVAYSYVAGKEFFMGEKLRRHFFVYNTVNLGQMLLMQLLVYALIAGSVPLTAPVLAHFLFTSTGTLAFEFLRKVRRPGKDGTGRDTYTWYLGFANALWVYFALVIANSATFFWLMALISANLVLWFLLSLIAVVLGGAWAVVHYRSRSRKTEQMLQLSFLLQYALLNLGIYLAIIYA